ncbi:hypothetical protein TBCH5v1_0101 [Thermococcus barophilus]|uniref:HTH asnC-type domain-containing protein n=2 Tax=Thermococcus barophilus TaxID=55802 RepID=A0A0S1X8N6_THEBA|nr:hypothetical protein TBCH5v1_0101 [Thermococcus barophilus]
MRIKIDPIDLRLIHELAENSRLSCNELAKKLKISRQRVARKLKKLEQYGVIKKYTIIPNFEKLDYVYASLGITLQPNAPIEEIIERLKKDRDVKVIERGIGSHDIILRVAVPKSLKGMEEKIHEITRTIGYVKDIDKTIITEVSKFEIL